jgi:nucleoside-diphosphate-sugar epimerase
MKNKISVTGSTGFIGKFLVAELKKNKSNIQEIKRNDFEGEKKLKKIIQKFEPDFVIHLASDSSPDDEKAYKNQIKSTIETSIKIALAIPKSTKLAIFFGSIEEYGESTIPYDENNVPQPISAYGWAKYTSYLAVKSILEKEQIPYLWLRPCLIVGRNASKKRLLGQLIDSIDTNKIFNPKNPNHLRDLMYIDDLAKIILYILGEYSDFKNIVLNISAGNYMTVGEVVKTLSTGEKKIKKNELKNLRPGYEAKINSTSLFRQKVKKIRYTPASDWKELVLKNTNN